MTREDCVFCRIVQGEIASHKIFEDDKTFAMLDVHPLAAGHTLVIPKTHVERVEDLDLETAKQLFATVRRLVGPIRRSVDASAATIGINNGREAGQVVPHLHVHIVPRVRGDGGGTIHSIMSRRPPLKEDLSGIARKIRDESTGSGQDAT